MFLNTIKMSGNKIYNLSGAIARYQMWTEFRRIGHTHDVLYGMLSEKDNANILSIVFKHM